MPRPKQTPHLPEDLRWDHLSRRFRDRHEALAAFIAMEAAEILSGVKPASLINLTDRVQPCGHNFYRLWRRYGSALLHGTQLHAWELKDRGDSMLLLLYRPDLLGELLQRKSVLAILRRAGYPDTSSLNPLLAELRRRLRGETFPHEIGIFLGYPLKDVLGFMGWARIPFACQGPWKIYGRREESLALAEVHRACRRRMALRLNCCCDPCDCLRDRRIRNC